MGATKFWRRHKCPLQYLSQLPHAIFEVVILIMLFNFNYHSAVVSERWTVLGEQKGCKLHQQLFYTPPTCDFNRKSVINSKIMQRSVSAFVVLRVL